MDQVLGLAFAALAVLFAVWNTVTLASYFTYRRLVSSSELTWKPAKPWFYNMCLGIGFFMMSMTAVSIFLLERPWLTNLSQLLMAMYYTVVFPLSFRIQRGFYGTGIWSERGFVPYRRIRWLGWKEKPDVVLALRTEASLVRPAYAFLKVPGEFYGQARRILATHVDDSSLSIEQGVLGLNDPDVPAQAQEQV